MGNNLFRSAQQNKNDDSRVGQPYQGSNLSNNNYCKPSAKYARQTNYHFQLAREVYNTLKQIQQAQLQNLRKSQKPDRSIIKLAPDIDGPIYIIQQKRATYQGRFREVNGQTLPSGIGKAHFKNGQFYAGDFVEGDATSSQGLYIFKDGSFYSGAFADGRFHGYGILSYKDKKMVYTGVFIQGKPHGQGSESHQDGSTFYGNFVEGKKQGKGTYTWPKQSRMQRKKYSGYFKDGIMHGEGIIYTQISKKIIFAGTMDEGLKQGEGILKTQHGSLEGKFEKDYAEGKGTFLWDENKAYQGFFKQSKMNGKGTIYYASGQIARGQWKNGHNICLQQITNNPQEASQKIKQIKTRHYSLFEQGKKDIEAFDKQQSQSFIKTKHISSLQSIKYIKSKSQIRNSQNLDESPLKQQYQEEL